MVYLSTYLSIPYLLLRCCMKFTYHFPAVMGVQAEREYYISMVPLKLLSKLFPVEEDIVLPEYRAQRRINEARIPEIKRYILDNRNSYVFSSIFFYFRIQTLYYFRQVVKCNCVLFRARKPSESPRFLFYAAERSKIKV